MPCIKRQQLNAMIIQYHLSIYHLSFLCQPHFQTFFFRVINRHNHQVTDTPSLHVGSLGQQVLPVEVRMKGQARVQVTVKMISTHGGKDNLIGDGSVEIGESCFGESRSVAIYDQSIGVKQVGLCVLDLLVSGHPANKNISSGRTKHKAEDGQKQQDNEVLSCMSYTVESDHSAVASQVAKAAQASDSPIKVHPVELQENIFVRENRKKSPLSKYNFMDQPLQSMGETLRQDQDQSDSDVEEESGSEVESEQATERSKSSQQVSSQSTQALNNIAYLSRKIETVHSKTKPIHNSSGNMDSAHFLRLNQRRSTQQTSPVTKSMDEKIEQSEQLVQRLQNHLRKYNKTEQTPVKKHEQSPKKRQQAHQKLMTSPQPPAIITEAAPTKPKAYIQPNHQKARMDVRQTKHKRRLKPIKVSQQSPSRPDLDFVTYHNYFQHQPYKTIRNVAVSNGTVQSTIQEMVILYTTYQKCASFHHRNYLAFCQHHSGEVQPVRIRLPDQERSFIVLVRTKQGRFQGIIKVEGSNGIKVPLKPVQEENYHDASDQGSWQLCFDMTVPPRSQSSGRQQRQEITGRDMEGQSAVKDIRLRVLTQSCQPWNYGQSHLMRQQSPKSSKSQKDGIKDPSETRRQDKEVQTEHIVLKSQPEQRGPQPEQREPQREPRPEKKDPRPEKKEPQRIIERQEKTVQTQAQEEKRAPIQALSFGNEQQVIYSHGSQHIPSKQSSSQVNPFKSGGSQHSPSSKQPSSHGSLNSKGIPLRRQNISELSASKRQRQAQKTSSVQPQGKKSSRIEDSRKKEVREINRLRNGNRNNYRFKDSKGSSEKEAERHQVKELWERLLLKKKVQEDERSLNQSRSKAQPSIHERRDTKVFLPQRQAVNSQKQRSLGSISNQTNHQQSRNARLYGCIAGTRQVLPVNPSWQQQTLYPTPRHPLRTISIELNNISISQPQALITREMSHARGKYLKLSIQKKISYLTEIIFNDSYNSILWKLSGCIFRQLSGQQRIQIELYQTVGSRSSCLGKASIRASKLFFLRNNHIYNGFVMFQGEACSQYTVGFRAEETVPFEVIREEEERTVVEMSRGGNLSHQGRKAAFVGEQSSRESSSLRNRVPRGKRRHGSAEQSLMSGRLMQETLKFSSGSTQQRR